MKRLAFTCALPGLVDPRSRVLHGRYREDRAGGDRAREQRTPRQRSRDCGAACTPVAAGEPEHAREVRKHVNRGHDEPHDEARLVQPEEDALPGPPDEQRDSGGEDRDSGRDDDGSEQPLALRFMEESPSLVVTAMRGFSLAESL